VVKGLQRELENEQLRSGRIMQEIERLRNEINELRQYSDTIKADLSQTKQNKDDDKLKSIFSSNKKFFDPRIVKYKETLQRVPERSY
jgi:predicted  nucleic acid-binding Zn-ribbon protein